MNRVRRTTRLQTTVGDGKELGGILVDELKRMVSEIIEVVLQDPDNRLAGDESFYDPPLVGVASADDPLFLELKAEAAAGHLHRLPREWLPGAKTVVSYFLPMSEAVRRANYEPGIVEPWLHARFRGEEFNNKVRRLLVDLMREWGSPAAAPLLEEGYAVDNEQYRSNWSERHVAYIAGLGTFSLNRGLITEKGMSGRFGSVVTALELQPTPRRYTGLHQHCPGVVEGSCRACIERCPAGAIAEDGKTKSICSHYLLLDQKADLIREKYGYPYLACGKCQTNVPCEDRIP